MCVNVKNNIKLKALIFVITIVLIVYFAKAPYGMFANLSIRDEYKDVYSQYENMSKDINMKSIYEEKQSILIKKVNELNIDTEILQDGIINELNNISRKNSIELNSVKFSEVMPILSDNSGLCMKVTVDFDSDFNDMLNFVDDVKKSKTIISIPDISILTIKNTVHVSLNLMFYALPMKTGVM
jgi:Tfp pilus assembly protein PilO